MSYRTRMPVSERDRYRCKVCRRWYYRTAHNSCTIAHAPGQCCHYSDVPADPPAGWLWRHWR